MRLRGPVESFALTFAVMLVLAVVPGCSGEDGGSSPDADTTDDASVSPDAGAGGLPVLHPFDPERAAAGQRFLFDEWPGDPMVPRLAITSLYLVWGTGSLSGDAYWDEFERRYGFFRPPGAELPLGFHDAGSDQLTLSCLACHADEGPGGEAIIGVGNRRLDFRRLVDDLETLAALAGVPAPQVPDDLQASPGAIDAVGLGLTLAAGDGEARHYGYQQAPAWWTQRFKNRNFTDGSGHVDNWRTMMATLMVFGWSEAQMMTYDDDFKDLQHYLMSLEPPAWPFEPPASEAVERGQALFGARCASCHGTYQGEAAVYPDLVVAIDEVGTDPLRTVSFSDAEVAALNASWFAEPAPFEDTDGYLAPPLVGVWASAPYLHNGSAPDLMSLLDSSARPARWRLVDPPAYDAARGGWAWEEADAGDLRAYDTAVDGLGATGHSFGDDLSADERADLIAYLTTL